MTRLSVVLCTYNRADSLEHALRSLAMVEVPAGLQWETLIVDNNSRDHTRRVAEGAPASLGARYLFEGRQGKSFALNTGIRQSTGEVLVFTDDDVTFHPTWLREIVAPFDAPDVVGVGGKIEAVWTGRVPDWWIVSGPRRLMGAIVHFDLGASPLDLEVPPFGANMAFRREVFDRVGGFRTNLGPTAGSLMRREDTELAARVMAVGRVVYAPRAIVYHPVEPGRQQKGYFRRWYFDYGRSTARMQGRPEGWPTWFGVPRYLFRDLAVSVTRAAASMFSRDAFFWQLAAVQAAGSVYEYSRRAAETGDATLQAAPPVIGERDEVR